MWKKSAIHQLQKWVPTSTEYLREQLRAVRDVQAEPPRPLIPHDPAPGNVDTDTGEVFDGEVVEPTDESIAALNAEAGSS